jgi:hypothetical protein
MEGLLCCYNFTSSTRFLKNQRWNVSLSTHVHDSLIIGFNAYAE